MLHLSKAKRAQAYIPKNKITRKGEKKQSRHPPTATCRTSLSSAPKNFSLPVGPGNLQAHCHVILGLFGECILYRKKSSNRKGRKGGAPDGVQKGLNDLAGNGIR
jgi:hypothetical protein